MLKPVLFVVILSLFFNFYNGNVLSQNTNFSAKYTVEYILKDIRGNEINKIKLYRNSDKLKFTTTSNKGKDNETTTDMYIFKNEQKVYTVISGRNSKVGTKHALDMSFVGMQTGVYILDLGNDGSIFNSNSRGGNGTVLGKDCVIYNLVTAPDGGSNYYMYQDNLMLKRFAGTSTDGSTLEAVSFDDNTEPSESNFILPTDVQFMDF